MIPSRFEQLFGQNRRIDTNTPELRFLALITEGRCAEAVALFDETRMFGEGLPSIDTPYGLFEGKAGIADMAAGWLANFRAASAQLVPVAQTRSGGRSVTEMVLHCCRTDGSEYSVPMAAVTELRADAKMDSLRLYYNWRCVPGTPAYRPPCFPARTDLTTRQEMIPGATGDYFRLLHDPKGGIIERADRIFADQVCFGGYEPKDFTDAFGPVPREGFVEHLSGGIGKTLSAFVRLRMETIIDDGKTCCVEWEQVVTEAGRKEAGRISQAGISFYELDDTGRIWSVRIIDYAYAEKEIDWSTARLPREEAERLNYEGA